MSFSRWLTLGVCVALMTVAAAGSAYAQAAAATVEQEDLTLPVPAEPTFILINLPTTLRLPKHKMSFNLTHRFQGDLTTGTFGDQLGNLFGLDNGAVIGFEFRYAPIDHLQVVAYRNTLDKTFQFSAQYDKFRQGSGAAGVDFTDLLDRRRRQLQRTLRARRLARSSRTRCATGWRCTRCRCGSITPRRSRDETRDTFFLGIGARYRLRGRAYLVTEVAPRLAGYEPSDPEYGFGIESRVGGHMFSLTFTNSFSTTYGQVARGGLPDSLFLGFNLGRKFY